MRKKYQREDILSVGSTLIREKGYHNTGINDILKASKIPKGSFYNFFESKEDFMLQVLDFYGNSFLENIKNILGDESLSPMTRIEKFYKTVTAINQEENCVAGCLVNNISSEVAGINPQLAERADIQFQKWTTYIAILIKKGQTHGEIIDTYEAKELADFIHQNFFGALSRMKSTKSVAPLDMAFKLTFDFIKK